MFKEKINMKKIVTFEEVKKLKLADPEFAKEYEALRPKYEAISLVIKNRLKKKMTQKDLADKIGTKQANISRFESGKTNPSLEFLNKLAQAFDKQVDIKFKAN